MIGLCIRSKLIIHKHMEKRLDYEAPETELFVVRFEENFLQTGGGNSNQRTLIFDEEGGAGVDPEVINGGSF